MKKLGIFCLIAMSLIVSSCSQPKNENKAETAKQENTASTDDLVLVQGGTFVNTKSNYFNRNVTIADFYIGKYEVTQQEWIDVMGGNPSQFKGSKLPVEMVSWYDVIEYCNKRSVKEGLTPYYKVDIDKPDPANKSEIDTVKWTVTVNEGANGYRLPNDAEWEYAAGGGQSSKSFKYSGSDNADDVAWGWRNAGDKPLDGDWNWPAIENNHTQTKEVGLKKPNELGLYDMSGNVREWVWDWFQDENYASGLFRIVRGGGWIGDVVNNESTYRGKFDANGFGPDQGFRVSRNK
ncbi:formylglycine-generating enzyme family protein [Paenibacillus kobensis]|uniref:formylglycine-generating enzyme family protein n=1 Tax=Paenibacillus kobensis TaxID=59841 RepID=UPI000FD6EE04|nr:SUMF1/EgtB/PvdO family nonheme iron enzyme [Paenibacillus kobensis]